MTGDRPPEEAEGIAAEDVARLDDDFGIALATWPAIDAAVEAIVTQISVADRLIEDEMRLSLKAVGLTMEEFKVLMQLHGGVCRHGTLSKRLGVSTGAMTNRLDKLEREGLVARTRDVEDRRGVSLSLTQAGRDRLDAYMERGANRERELLAGLSAADKRRLNALLGRLVDALRAG